MSGYRKGSWSQTWLGNIVTVLCCDKDEASDRQKRSKR
jgi:hypothetical protein